MADAPYYFNRLRSSRSPAATFSKLRAEIPVSMRGKLLALVQNSRYLRPKLFHDPFPATLTPLKNFRPLSPGSLEDEIDWCARRCLVHGDELGRFGQLRYAHDEALLQSDFPRAIRVLDDIQNEFGHSLWLIKRRIHVLQQASGLEAQKQFAESVKNSCADHGVAAFLTHYISVRNCA